MCRILKLDISSYYHWIRNGCIIKKIDYKLNKLIKTIFVQSRCKYGTRRLKDKLQRLHGLVVSKRRIGNIMKDLNLIANKKKKYKVNTTDSNHNLPIAPNILNRDFYASYSHRDLLQQNNIIQSMSRKGNCWDNAVAESFFHTLKTELTYHELYETKSQANQSIFEYIEVYYNRQRMHSTNNNYSPVEFEEMMLQNEKVA